VSERRQYRFDLFNQWVVSETAAFAGSKALV
jgi:hypothetical protein